ncbi:MAG: halocarboxylic acid dehydrogenase DehI family protein [Chloroflexota bacterium]
MAELPRVSPVKKESASPEVRAVLDDIQNTMGVPWPPANWRSQAMYPGAMRLFWERLKPAVATQQFLLDSLQITEWAYGDVGKWYRPGYSPSVPESQRQRIEWELDAFQFGNPQLLIQQIALDRMLRGETVGRDEECQPRQQRSAYRQPEIKMVTEREATPQIKRLYGDIKQTLNLPVVNSDYQAMAKWPDFFWPGWDDLKQWRDREEYQHLWLEIAHMGEEAVNRLCPSLSLDQNEVRRAVGDPGEYENLRRMVDMFVHLLPGLIANDTLLRYGIAAGRTVVPPRPEGEPSPGSGGR